MYRWEKLLKAYRDSKFPEYSYGFTFKMIVGTCQNPPEEKFENEEIAKTTSQNIFSEMKSYNEEGIIVQSTFCDIHNGAVFSFADTDWKENSISVTFDDVWQRYGKEIIEGKYNISKTDRDKIRMIYNL